MFLPKARFLDPLKSLPDRSQIHSPGPRVKWFILFVLCLGGGAVYLLPYIRYSYYDPLISALGLNHAQFGSLMTVYGMANIPAYFLGGLLADRVQARLLISFSLIATGLAGFYYATLPGYQGALFVHLVWSVTTILTFWAAMMKTVKLLGDSSDQGKVFGFRESGFGLMALIYSMVGLTIFSTTTQELTGLQYLLLFYGSVLVASGIISFIVIPDQSRAGRKSSRIAPVDLLPVLRTPGIGTAAVIIFCAYSISIGLGYMTPYLSDVLGLNVSLTALLATTRTYGIALFGGALGGIIVDQLHSSVKYLIFAFLGTAGLVLVLILTPGVPVMLYLVAAVMLLVAVVVYTVKGVYFVLVDELGVDNRRVGTAVGVLSVIGFLPDAFLFALFGLLLDQYPGESGYKLIFAIMLGLSVVGFICCIVLFKRIYRARKAEKPTATFS